MAGAARRRRWRLKGCNGTDEDVLTYAMFPQVAPKFFSNARTGPEESRQGSRRAKPAAGARGGTGNRPPHSSRVR